MVVRKENILNMTNINSALFHRLVKNISNHLKYFAEKNSISATILDYWLWLNLVTELKDAT